MGLEYFSLYNSIKKNLVGERVSKGNKKLDFLISLLIIIGVILIIYDIQLLENTVISSTILLIFFFVPGIILTPLLKNKLNNIDGRKGHTILHYFLHCITSGSFILTAFLYLNKEYTDDSINETRIPITERINYTDEKGKNTKYFKATYMGFENKYILKKENESLFEHSNSIKIFTKIGLFGYEILDSWRI